MGILGALMTSSRRRGDAIYLAASSLSGRIAEISSS
jgi:hypothetical protein